MTHIEQTNSKQRHPEPRTDKSTEWEQQRQRDRETAASVAKQKIIPNMSD